MEQHGNAQPDTSKQGNHPVKRLCEDVTTRQFMQYRPRCKEPGGIQVKTEVSKAVMPLENKNDINNIELTNCSSSGAITFIFKHN